MRIVVSNPDNLGDFVLREPMFAAIHDAGHELMLVVRDFVAPLANDMAPYAEVAVCAENPYSPNFAFGAGPNAELAKQVERFSPDRLVVPAYQYTELDQGLAAHLRGVEVVGLSGYLFQPQPHITLPSTISFYAQVQVSLDTPESIRNELVCSAILGKKITLRPPRLSPTDVGRSIASAHLAKIGLKSTPFWAVCAGDRAPSVRLRNWEQERWVEMCRRLIEQHGIRILFIGIPEEDADTKAIQASLGLAARHTASITGEPIAINELVGLLDAAQGYIGKDTGPMHLAAALGKPVVAVFGGGTWPRFIPLARTGAAFSVDVPCKGCNWICRMKRSYCVKDIPLAPVLRIVEKLNKGDEVPFYVDLLPRDSLLEAEMFQDMESAYKLLDAERHNFAQWHSDRVQDIEELKSRVEATKREAEAEARAAMAKEVEALVEASAVEITSPDRAIAKFNHHVRGLETEVAILTSASRDCREERGVLLRQLADARFEVDKLENRASALDHELGHLHDQIKHLEQANAELGIRLAQAETRKSDAEAAVFGLEAELSQNLITVARLQTDMDTCESRHLGRIADLEKALELQKRDLQATLTLIPELRTELIAAQGELAGSFASIREFASRFGVTGNDMKGFLESVAGRLESAESRACEFAGVIRELAGERAREDDWKENLAVVRTLLAEAMGGWHAAQREVDEFTRQLQAAAAAQVDTDWRSGLSFIENDRVRRGEQIELLHQHIANLAVEQGAQLNRVPIRLMRALHLL